MGILRKFIEDYKLKKQIEKDFENQIRAERRVQEKMKDANERELERYMEDMRKARIEKQLKQFRSQKQSSMWKANSFRNNKNLFKNKPCKLGVQSYR